MGYQYDGDDEPDYEAADGAFMLGLISLLAFILLGGGLMLAGVVLVVKYAGWLVEKLGG